MQNRKTEPLKANYFLRKYQVFINDLPGFYLSYIHPYNIYWDGSLIQKGHFMIIGSFILPTKITGENNH